MDEYLCIYQNDYWAWKREAPQWLRDAIDSDRVSVYSRADEEFGWKIAGRHGFIDDGNVITKDDVWPLAVEESKTK